MTSFNATCWDFNTNDTIVGPPVQPNPDVSGKGVSRRISNEPP